MDEICSVRSPTSFTASSSLDPRPEATATQTIHRTRKKTAAPPPDHRTVSSLPSGTYWLSSHQFFPAPLLPFSGPLLSFSFFLLITHPPVIDTRTIPRERADVK